MKKEDIKKQPWFYAAKNGQRDLIHLAGGIERIADFLGVSKALVGTWNNLNDAALMPQWVIWALEADIGQSKVSQAMARNVGASVVAGSGGRGGSSCLDAAKAGAMVEISHLTMAFVDADADGYRSRSEIMSIRGEFVDLGNVAQRGVSICDSELAKLDANGGA